MKLVAFLSFITLGFSGIAQITALLELKQEDPFEYHTISLEEYEEQLDLLSYSIDTSHHMFYYMRAELRTKAMLLEYAIADYEKALLMAPEAPYTFYGLGLAYSIKEEWETALIYLDSALIYYPDYTLAQLEKAELLLFDQQYEASAKIIQDVIDRKQFMDLNWAKVYATQGYNYEMMKELPKAMKYMAKSAELWPSPESYYAVGSIAKQMDKLEESIPFFKQAIKLDSSHFMAMFDLAVSLSFLGRHEQSLSYFEDCFRLDTTEIHAYQYSLYANALMRSKHYQKAIEEFDKSIAIDPNIAENYYWKGMCLKRLKQEKDACDCWSKALELNRALAEEMFDQNCKGKKLVNHPFPENEERKKKGIQVYQLPTSR